MRECWAAPGRPRLDVRDRAASLPEGTETRLVLPAGELIGIGRIVLKDNLSGTMLATADNAAHPTQTPWPGTSKRRRR